MAKTTPNSDGVFGLEKVSSQNNEFNAISFLVKQILGKSNIATMVKIIAVHTVSRVGPVGFVDVQPLLNQQDGVGQPIPHGTVYNIPFVRLQGGSNAVIVDPKKDDIGLCVFCDRDISTIKTTGKVANPASKRRFAMSDGVYIGGWGNSVQPLRYTLVDDDGIVVEANDGIIKVNGKTITITADSISVASKTTNLDLGALTQKSYSKSETITGVCTITTPLHNVVGISQAKSYRVNGRQVVGPRLPAIAPATSPADVVGKFNILLAGLKIHGLFS